MQGLTEFLPISSTAHLLLGGRLLGFEDPGGVFTVMIQLGAVLAVMWLYRAKIIGVVSRTAVEPTRAASPSCSSSRSFRRGLAGVLLVGLRQGPALRRVRHVIARRVHRRRRRHAAGRAVPAARRSCSRPTRRRSARAFGVGVLPDAGADSRRVAVGRDDRRRPADAARPSGGRGVLVLSGDADDGRRVCCTICGRCAITWRRSAAAEIAIGFVMAFLAALLVVKPFLRYRRAVGFRPVRLVSDRAGAGDLRRD